MMSKEESLIETIQKLYEAGELNTDTSIKFILQVSIELYKGQLAIFKSLEDRQTSIDELKHEMEEQKVQIDTIEKEIEIINRNSFSLWVGRHPVIAKFILGGLIILFNFHDIVTEYLLGLLGIKLP